jgi:hypothetical protein
VGRIDARAVPDAEVAGLPASPPDPVERGLESLPTIRVTALLWINTRAAPNGAIISLKYVCRSP